MREQEVIEKLDEFVLKRYQSSNEMTDNYIKEKLTDLRDRLVQWASLIEKKKGVKVLRKRSIIFDVAAVILEREEGVSIVDEHFLKKYELPFSQYDKIMIYSYMNWELSEPEIRALGYDLPCPYDPYLDLLKAGSRFLSYDHNKLEVCNVGVEVFSSEDMQ